MSKSTSLSCAQPHHRNLTTPDHKIHYRAMDKDAPAGRIPIVLVHGYLLSGAYMEPAMQHLAPHHPVYAPDLPGHGKSSKPRKTLDTKELAQALLQWSDAAGIKNMILIGNSLGCATATHCAMLAPDRIERLVLQGPAMEPEKRHPLHSFLRTIEHLRQAAGTGFDAIAWNDYRMAGIKHALASWQLALEDRIEDRLPHIQAPTLVVHGECDPLVTLDWATRVAWLLGDGHLSIVPEGDHILIYHKAELFSKLVIRFLQSPAHSLQTPAHFLQPPTHSLATPAPVLNAPTHSLLTPSDSHNPRADPVQTPAGTKVTP